MNTNLLRFVMAAVVACVGVSCTTAYDAYGYPRQVVEPGTAVAGAAAVGLLAYGLSERNHHRHSYDRHPSYYSRGRGYYPAPRSYYRAPRYHHGHSHRGYRRGYY